MFDARHLLESHTEVLMSWTDDTEEKLLKALTFITDDYLQTLSGADLVLISKTKGVFDYFRKIVVLSASLCKAVRGKTENDSKR